MTVRFNPFPSSRRWVWQGQVENRDPLPLPAPPTDRDDLVGVIQIHTIDLDWRSEQRGHEWADEVLLEHHEKSDPLFRVAIRIDDRFFNEFVEPALGKPSKLLWCV